MNWGALVERVARALGVWGHDELRSDGPRWTLRRPHEKLRVRRILEGEQDITTGDAILLLLAYARGMRLDVGPCKACAERGGGWEWSLLWLQRIAREWRERGWTVKHIGDLHTHVASRPCPECSEPGPEVECEACEGNGWSEVARALREYGDDLAGSKIVFGPDTVDRVRHDVMRIVAEHGHPDLEIGAAFNHQTRAVDVTGIEDLYGACPDCDGKGRVHGPPRPTGRDHREAHRWVLDAAGEACPCCDGSGDFEDDPDPGCLNCESSGRVLADLAVRDASAVLADQLQAQGDQAGIALAAWLRGQCSACKGTGIGQRVALVNRPTVEFGSPIRFGVTLIGYEHVWVGSLMDVGDTRARVESVKVRGLHTHRAPHFMPDQTGAWVDAATTSPTTDIDAVEVGPAQDDGTPRVVPGPGGCSELVCRCAACRGLGHVLGAPSIAVESILDEALDAYEQDPGVVEHREVARPDLHARVHRRVDQPDRRHDVRDARD